MSKKQQKQALRRSILAKRDDLDPQYRELASKQIIQKVMGLEEFKKAKTIMTFVSFSSEVDTLNFINGCWKLGKVIVTPLAIMETRELIIYEINNWKQLQPGVYGILEPIPAKDRLIKPGKIDLVINPGVAFDEELNRMGYGGGFYDRFYHKLNESCIRVAISYEMQIVEKVPIDQYDIPVDILITEKRIIRKAEIT